MKNTLIPMTQFVLRIDEIVKLNKKLSLDNWINAQLKVTQRYAKFLSQPLTLGMFVPCNDAGEVLEEPKPHHTLASENADEYRKKYDAEMKAYQSEKERVLFEGFELGHDDEGMYVENKEDVCFFPENFGSITVKNLLYDRIHLTQSALKQIGINEIPEIKC